MTSIWKTAAGGEFLYLPDAGHFLMGHTGDIDAFLQKALRP